MSSKRAKLKTYRVWFSDHRSYYHDVKAASEDQAIAKAEDLNDLGDEGRDGPGCAFAEYVSVEVQS